MNCGQMLLICLLLSCLLSCQSTKIFRRDVFYTVKRGDGANSNERLGYEVKHGIKADVTEQTGYLQLTIKNVDSLISKGAVAQISRVILNKKTDDPDKIDVLYFGGKNADTPGHFNYYTGTFGLQALTIPLKFRPALSNKAKYPAQVETAVNIGFAGGFKFTLNHYTTKKNLWNKNSVQYSITPGALIGLGAEPLKAAVNAPNLPVDRTSAMFTYGGFVLIGINNINVGYAFGFDNVFGDGKHYWGYQNQLWQGVIISLDILKF
jgi:hypothetical protein